MVAWHLMSLFLPLPRHLPVSFSYHSIFACPPIRYMHAYHFQMWMSMLHFVCINMWMCEFAWVVSVSIFRIVYSLSHFGLCWKLMLEIIFITFDKFELHHICNRTQLTENQSVMISKVPHNSRWTFIALPLIDFLSVHYQLHPLKHQVWLPEGHPS